MTELIAARQTVSQSIPFPTDLHDVTYRTGLARNVILDANIR